MNKSFTLECEMEERWIPYFLAFLEDMQACGNIGHSEILGFYADGDGDFRPKFTIKEIKYQRPKFPFYKETKTLDIYDAG